MMSKATRSISAALLALALTLALSGCGGDDDKTRARIPKSRLKSSAVSLTPEQQAEVKRARQELVANMMLWPEGEGPARDVTADSDECKQRLEAKRSLATANPLIQLTWMARCMAEKGWVLNPDAQVEGG